MQYTFRDLLQQANAPCRLCGGDNKLSMIGAGKPELVLDYTSPNTIGGYRFDFDTKYYSKPKFSIVIHPNSNLVSSNQTSKLSSIVSHFVIGCSNNDCVSVETSDVSFKETSNGWVLNPLAIHYEHIPLTMSNGSCYVIDNFVCANRCTYKIWSKSEYGVVRYVNAMELPIHLEPFLSKTSLIQKIELIELLA